MSDDRLTAELRATARLLFGERRPPPTPTSTVGDDADREGRRLIRRLFAPPTHIDNDNEETP